MSGAFKMIGFFPYLLPLATLYFLLAEAGFFYEKGYVSRETGIYLAYASLLVYLVNVVMVSGLAIIALRKNIVESQRKHAQAAILTAVLSIVDLIAFFVAIGVASDEENTVSEPLKIGGCAVAGGSSMG